MAELSAVTVPTNRKQTRMKVISEVSCAASSASPRVGDMNIHQAIMAERTLASMPSQKPPSKVATTIAG
jgi:hypothetical protein